MDKNPEIKKDEGELVLIYIFVYVILLFPLGLFVYRIWNWLKTASWIEIPASEILGAPPETKWLGLNEIIVKLWAFPIEFVLIAAGALSLMVINIVNDKRR